MRLLEQLFDFQKKKAFDNHLWWAYKAPCSTGERFARLNRGVYREKERHMKKLLKGILAFIVILIVIPGLTKACGGTSESDQRKLLTAQRRDVCENQYNTLTYRQRFDCAKEFHVDPFLGWHSEMELRIMKDLNDPYSMQWDRMAMMPSGAEDETYTVSATFRSKNAFGVYIKHSALATCDLRTGKVLDLQYFE